MNFKNLKKGIYTNKFKLLAFMVGYIFLIIDTRMLKEMTIIINNVDMFYGIIFNLIYVLLAYTSTKIMLVVFSKVIIISSDSFFEKLLSYLKIVSIGAYIAFMCLIGQAFIIGMLTEHGTIG